MSVLMFVSGLTLSILICLLLVVYLIGRKHGFNDGYETCQTYRPSSAERKRILNRERINAWNDGFKRGKERRRNSKKRRKRPRHLKPVSTNDWE